MITEIDLIDLGKDLERTVDRFPAAQVLVVGDIIMDEYIWGNVSRISPEAPVPVVEVQQDTKMLGGAANVLNNLISLGGRAFLCGVVGDDPTGREILHQVAEIGGITEGIVLEPDRPTSIKTRIVAHSQQVVRFDRESRRSISKETVDRILGFVMSVKDRLNAVVVADYGKGVISSELMAGLRRLLADTHVVLAVDPKISHFEFYRGVDVITPNHHEAGVFCRMEIVDEETLVRAGEMMLRELECRSVLITQGKDGMTLFENGGNITHIPTVARKVFDVTGAGDTVVSAFCLGLASGMDLRAAAVISNFAAGIVVGEVGTSTVRAEELKRVIRERLKPR